MANKNKKNKNKPKRVLTVVQRQAINKLDEKAKEYARLIMDPCAAPLTHPVYPGGDAGFLFRAESFFTIATAPTQTAGVLHWTPGYPNASGTELIGYWADTATASLATVVVGGPAPLSSSPGKAFLNTNARGARCVAACMKVTFPGSESSRSGRVHYGHTTAGTIDLGQFVSADAIAQLLQHYGRTPTDTIELYWQPGIADTEFNDPTEAAGAIIRDRKTALTVAFAGFPAGVGLTFHLTAIYEWTPVQNLGLANNSLGKNMSRNSMDDVLDAIKRTGFTFVKHVGMAGLNYFTNGVSAGIQQMFGLMPAVGRNRSRQLLLQ